MKVMCTCAENQHPDLPKVEVGSIYNVTGGALCERKGVPALYFILEEMGTDNYYWSGLFSPLEGTDDKVETVTEPELVEEGI